MWTVPLYTETARSVQLSTVRRRIRMGWNTVGAAARQTLRELLRLERSALTLTPLTFTTTMILTSLVLLLLSAVAKGSLLPRDSPQREGSPIKYAGPAKFP